VLQRVTGSVVCQVNHFCFNSPATIAVYITLAANGIAFWITLITLSEVQTIAAMSKFEGG